MSFQKRDSCRIASVMQFVLELLRLVPDSCKLATKWNEIK